VVGATHPSVHVTTDVIVKVLVWVTGVVTIVEPLVTVLQVTGQISKYSTIMSADLTYQGRWLW